MGNTPTKEGEPSRNTPAFYMKREHWHVLPPATGKIWAELTKENPWPEEGSFVLEELEGNRGH